MKRSGDYVLNAEDGRFFLGFVNDAGVRWISL